MFDGVSGRTNWRGAWLTATAVVVILASAGVAILLVGRKPDELASASIDPPRSIHFSSHRPANFDDSGFRAVTSFELPVKDPSSLEHLRDCYQGAGRRGVLAIRKELAQSSLLPLQRLERLETLARCHLYEAEFRQAATVLEEAHALIDANTERLLDQLPALLFLQGVAALRLGETENCVECGCESSCILPILPRAVHQKPEGSKEAVRYFTEYLRLCPDDIGVRWLLNLAHMTLGQHPDGVDREYLLSLDPLRSEFDVGRFVDIAPQLGVNRLNMAGGAIMDDFDNDGLLDIITTTMDEAAPMVYYHNRGDGTFEDRTKAAGLDGQLGGLYCVQTDYNNDGWLDVYVARGGWKGPMRHSLLRNNGDGTFTDVTRAAGLDTPVGGQVAVWADYDNDGWLDLFVGSEPQQIGDKSIPSRCRLYHNRGDGTFEEVGLKAGVANEGFFCKGANWGDYDGDGYPDLFVANLNGPCRLFHNNRDGTFTDVAFKLGITRPHSSFPCWFFDYDNDGWLDLFVGSYDRTLNDVVNSLFGKPFQVEPCRLYHNLGGKGFEDVTVAAGLNAALTPMGSNFFDLDNDGFLDFYLGTGDPNYSMLVPNRMFKNVGGKRFADVTMSSGTGHLQKGHSVAAGDWDGDGNIDLFVQLGGATPGDRFRDVFFQNPGHNNRWVTVQLIGKKTNRAAIGARIHLVLPGAGPNHIYRTVTTGSSFGANPLQQTIGLGRADRITTLEVYWPTSRTTQAFHDLEVNQGIEITEFDSKPRCYQPRKVAWKSSSVSKK